MQQELVETSNKSLRNLKNNRGVTEKATNLGELCLLLKIHIRLSEVPGKPVIPNCSTPTEKLSQFSDGELKMVLQEGCLYIKDSVGFIKKLKNIDHIPPDTIMVKVDVVGLYPSKSHVAGLEILRKALDNQVDKKIPTDNLN